MDSMQNVIGTLLSNPESMKQIMQLVSSLGLNNTNAAAPAAPVAAVQEKQAIQMPPPVMSQRNLDTMSANPYAAPYQQAAPQIQETAQRPPTPFDPITLSRAEQPQPQVQSQPASAAAPEITPEKAMEVLQRLQSPSQPAVADNHMALLNALKPFMRSSRQSSLDGAVKLLGAYRTFKGMGMKLF